MYPITIISNRRLAKRHLKDQITYIIECHKDAIHHKEHLHFYEDSHWITNYGDCQIIIREPDMAYDTYWQLIDELLPTMDQCRMLIHGMMVQGLEDIDRIVTRDLYVHMPLYSLQDMVRKFGKSIDTSPMIGRFLSKHIKGTSIHSVGQWESWLAYVKKYSITGWDYILISPVLPTSCKPNAIALGKSGVVSIINEIHTNCGDINLDRNYDTRDMDIVYKTKNDKTLPFRIYALGGVTSHTYQDVLTWGVDGIAMMSEAMTI